MRRGPQVGSSRTLLCRRGDPAGVDLCVNGSSHSIPRLSPHPEKRGVGSLLRGSALGPAEHGSHVHGHLVLIGGVLAWEAERSRCPVGRDVSRSCECRW